VSAAGNPAEHQLLLERIVREIKPHAASIPSLADGNPDRREEHRLARAAVAEIPTILAYETGSSTADFHPTRFVDIAPFLTRKLEVLTAYRTFDRPELRAGGRPPLGEAPRVRRGGGLRGDLGPGRGRPVSGDATYGTAGAGGP